MLSAASCVLMSAVGFDGRGPVGWKGFQEEVVFELSQHTRHNQPLHRCCRVGSSHLIYCLCCLGQVTFFDL